MANTKRLFSLFPRILYTIHLFNQCDAGRILKRSDIVALVIAIKSGANCATELTHARARGPLYKVSHACVIFLSFLSFPIVLVDIVSKLFPYPLKCLRLLRTLSSFLIFYRVNNRSISFNKLRPPERTIN